MSRRPDPLRIAAARRAAAIARLVSSGESADRAATWVARWEAAMDRPRERADWESFEAWLANERSRGARPESR